ncbi:MAG: exodeoxyribonuclease VII large subunit [Chloroflexi bacterium]|nr:exodeoxyribonuclease VII large subunit [Chloroflexota bacterium]
MDISVSHLNGRLAQKLPPELPLGLVFVVGEVAELDNRHFVLLEGSHRLSCRAEEEITAVAVGDEVRVSGHLMFDDRRLQYYLRVGDIERMTQEPLDQLGSDSRELLSANDGLLSALAEVKARAAVAPTEPVEGEGVLPVWVQKMAPAEANIDVVQDDKVGHVGREDELNAGLVTMLSKAMDSDEEMELTPELLAPYLPMEPEGVDDEDVGAVVEKEEETAVSLANLSSSYRPPNREDTDWLVILLLISFFILMIAVVVAIVLLLLQ